MKLIRVLLAICFLVTTAGISLAADQQAPSAPAAKQEAQPAPQPAPSAPAAKQEAQPAPQPAPPAADAKKDMKKDAATKKVSKAKEATPVNINTASEKELKSLPGIGKILAKRIVEYRTKNGPFSTPEDLLKVKGITKKTFEKIKGHIVLQ